MKPFDPIPLLLFAALLWAFLTTVLHLGIKRHVRRHRCGDGPTQPAKIIQLTIKHVGESHV